MRKKKSNKNLDSNFVRMGFEHVPKDLFESKHICQKNCSSVISLAIRALRAKLFRNLGVLKKNNFTKITIISVGHVLAVLPAKSVVYRLRCAWRVGHVLKRQRKLMYDLKISYIKIELSRCIVIDFYCFFFFFTGCYRFCFRSHA